ncbi:MAG: arginine synthesis PII-interacting regulator PirA [Xenococcaceae cyanobacterium]
MLRSLERRLETARAKGDENLVGLLEAEASYLNMK